MAAAYKVEKRGTSSYVIGLQEDSDHPDTQLFYQYFNCISSPGMMLYALDDLYQRHDGLRNGDMFETEFGWFGCEGKHVLYLGTSNN